MCFPPMMTDMYIPACEISDVEVSGFSVNMMCVVYMKMCVSKYITHLPAKHLRFGDRQLTIRMA